MNGVYCQICCVFPEFTFANHYEICQGLQMYFYFRLSLAVLTSHDLQSPSPRE